MAFTSRTGAHNLVVIDEVSQRRRGRGGSFSLFETAGTVKAMRASSRAYECASVYERTVLQVDHGAAGFYWLDLFKVRGGKLRDYLFHGVNNDFMLEGAEKPVVKPKRDETERRFCLQLAVRQLGTWEFSDVEVCQIDNNGNDISENLASEFPAEGAKNRTVCKGWGRYGGNGKSSWEPCAGKSGLGVRYSAETMLAGEKEVNQALVIGESNGYTGVNALLGKVGATYRFRFYARGDDGTFAPRVLMFPYGEEHIRDSRYFQSVAVNENRLGADWRLYEGTFTITRGERSLRLDLTPAILRKGEHGAWKAVWNLGDGQRFAVYSPYADGEELLYGDEWGQRFYNNRDKGATLPYFARRRKGSQLDCFVTVFHSYFGDASLVKDVRVTERPEGVVAVVQTSLGEDAFLFAANGRLISSGDVESDAEIAAVLERGSQTAAMAMFLGKRLKSGTRQLTCQASRFEGRIVQAVNRKEDAYFVLEGDCSPEDDWKGHTLIVTGDDGVGRPYQIVKSAWVDGEFRAYTRVDGVGLPARDGKSWRLPNWACAEF